MPPVYYVIELSARWLTVLLVALALALVMAFAFGYGAAWSVLANGGPEAGPSPATVGAVESTPAAVVAELVATSPPVTPSVATPVVVPTITALPRPAATQRATPSPVPSTPTPQAAPLATATPAVPAQSAADQVFWVQVLAASQSDALPEARKRLDGLGFPAANQSVVATDVAGGNKLYKLRIGPFPDRESADRVVRRMQGSGFPDAWIVVP